MSESQNPQQPPQQELEASSEQPFVEPVFENLEDAPGAQVDNTPTKVIPYSDEEIISGAAILVMMGLSQTGRVTNEKEEKAFARPFDTYTPLAIRTLKLGDALAHYGIGKNTGIGGLEKMPPLIRLALGFVGIGFGVVMGLQAVQKVRDEAPTASV